MVSVCFLVHRFSPLMFALLIIQLKDKWILMSDPTKKLFFLKKETSQLCVRSVSWINSLKIHADTRPYRRHTAGVCSKKQKKRKRPTVEAACWISVWNISWKANWFRIKSVVGKQGRKSHTDSKQVVGCCNLG